MNPVRAWIRSIEKWFSIWSTRSGIPVCRIFYLSPIMWMKFHPVWLTCWSLGGNRQRIPNIGRLHIPCRILHRGFPKPFFPQDATIAVTACQAFGGWIVTILRLAWFDWSQKVQTKDPCGDARALRWKWQIQMPLCQRAGETLRYPIGWYLYRIDLWGACSDRDLDHALHRITESFQKDDEMGGITPHVQHRPVFIIPVHEVYTVSIPLSVSSKVRIEGSVGFFNGFF